MASGNFLGIKYPILKDSQGYIAQVSDTATIKSDLLILLLTNFGERVMLPNFGTGLSSLLFQPNNAIVETSATNLIRNAISAWEPRVAVSQISVVSSATADAANPNNVTESGEHVLTITVQFSQLDNLTQIDTLVLQLPIG